MRSRTYVTVFLPPIVRTNESNGPINGARHANLSLATFIARSSTTHHGARSRQVSGFAVVGLLEPASIDAFSRSLFDKNADRIECGIVRKIRNDRESDASH